MMPQKAEKGRNYILQYGAGSRIINFNIPNASATGSLFLPRKALQWQKERMQMQFNSSSFLFYYLPLTMAAYYIAPVRHRNMVLLASGLLFYGWGLRSVWPLGILLTLTVLVWATAKALSWKRQPWILGAALFSMAAILVFFKLAYGGRYLPAGMSFYLFQMAAYLIDVYREKCEAEHSFLTFGAQVVMFPKLLSGPIISPQRLQAQFLSPCDCGRTFRLGLKEFILGLGLKVLLADRVGGIWAQAGVAGFESISTPFAWMALVSYAMRLYFDFYGYSLMAVGLGRMLGFHLPMNFLEPYSAGSVSAFYRRWHVTLGAWFREYVYIPLGGNRNGILRTVCNLAIVWTLTGFWHGVGGNYLIWAGFLFLLIVNERLWLGKLLKRTKILCHVYTVFVILLSWVPFAVADHSQMILFVQKLFGFGCALNPHDFINWGRQYWQILLAGVLFATPLPKKLWLRFQQSYWTDGLAFILFWICVYFISTSAQDPFMYFQY